MPKHAGAFTVPATPDYTGRRRRETTPPPATVTCPACAGTGRNAANLDCARCGGNGLPDFRVATP